MKNELDELLHGLDDNPSSAHNPTSSGNIHSVSSSTHQVPNLSNQDNNDRVIEDKLISFGEAIGGLKQEVITLRGKMEGGEEALSVGGFNFSNRDNFLLWCTENIEGVIPYGCFCDVYTFLNRMIDSVGSVTAFVNPKLHNVVDQHKLGLGGDDALTLESFQLPTPKIFGNGTSISSLKTSSRTWIGTMPSSSSWEDPRTSMGIRDRLRKQIPNIKSQIMTNIRVRLNKSPIARSLAVACLEATIAFINSLSTWISDTHGRLTSHGYSDDLSWQLVTKVVHHVFTSDLDKARNFVRDGVNTSNPQLLHGSILWGIFQTHRAMDEYMQHGFSSHPAVASQYLEFLVESRGSDTKEDEDNLSKAVAKLESKIEAIDKIAKEARSSASSAANGLDQLKTKVNNISRNRNGGGGNGST